MSRRVWRTTLISFGLGSFLVGLAVSRRISLEPSMSWSGVFFWTLLIILSWLVKIKSCVCLLAICMIGLLLGIWRGTVFKLQIQPYQDLAGRSVKIRAVAKSDSVYGDKSQLDFDVGKVQITDPVKQDLVGKIHIKGYGETMVYSGDTVEASGKLYLAKGSRQGGISYAQINKLQSGHSWTDKLRRNFASGIQNALPVPLGSFGLGLLIGQRTTLPDSLNEQLSTVGLTHIVAVSGYNLTIMVLLAHRLAKSRSKFQSFILTIGLIILFDLMTGFSASIIRATIVSVLSLMAWYYGRKFRPIVILLLSAALTAGFFPPYLWSDVGWYLSFLAFTGVLIVSPLIVKRYFRRPPKPLTLMLVESVSAIVMTLPVIMLIFGRLSLVAVIANMLIVPLVPIAMGLCFVAGLAGMLVPAIVGYFAWPATLLMTYFTGVINLLAKVPMASINLSMNLRQLIFSYITIIVFCLILSKKSGVVVSRQIN